MTNNAMIVLRLPEELRRRLKERCEAEGRTTSGLLRMWIRNYVGTPSWRDVETK